MAVAADHGLNAVALEVTDQTGSGLRTYFGLDQALDVALRLVAAVLRLRGRRRERLSPATEKPPAPGRAGAVRPGRDAGEPAGAGGRAVGGLPRGEGLGHIQPVRGSVGTGDRSDQDHAGRRPDRHGRLSRSHEARRHENQAQGLPKWLFSWCQNF